MKDIPNMGELRIVFTPGIPKREVVGIGDLVYILRRAWPTSIPYYNLLVIADIGMASTGIGFGE